MPMVSLAMGVPVTVTGSSYSTTTPIRSPAMKAPPAPVPVPESERPVTAGERPSEPSPSTRKELSLLTACVPRPSAAALPARSAMLPEFSPSAEAPTLMPSASSSAAATA